MNEQDRVTFYLGMQDAGFAAGSRAAKEQFEQIHRAASPEKLESGFQRVGTALTALATSYALTAIIRGMKDVHAEFANAEAAVVAFNRATKAGGIDREGVALMRDYADEMKRFGFDDEQILSVQKIALNMGFGAEQAREFARVAIDLGGPLGKVEEAAQALAAAHNGNARGLKQFGIYVDEVKLKSEGLNAVVSESDRLYRGAGQEMGTAAANVRLLSTAYGDLKENLGEIVAGSGAIQFLQGLVNITGILLEKMRVLRGMMPGGGVQQIPLASSHGNYPSTMLPGHSGGAGTAPVVLPVLVDPPKPAKAKTPEQIAKEAWEAFEAGIGREAAIAREGGLMAGPVAQWFIDQAALASGRIMNEAYDDLGNDTGPQAALRQAARNASAPYGALGASGYDLDAVLAGQLDTFGQEQAKREAEFTQARIDAIDQAQEALDKATDAERRNARVLADENQRFASQQFAAMQNLVSVAYAVRGIIAAAGGGDSGAFVSSLGSGIMMAGGMTMNPYLLGAGAALNMAGGFIKPGGSEEGKRRETLKDYLKDAGFKDFKASTSPQNFNAGMAGDGQVAGSQFGNMWQSWADAAMGGSTASGANVLLGAFGSLNLTLGQTADVVGGLIAQAQGLSDAAGDQIAAQEALLSNAALTADQLSELALLYGSSSTYLEEEARLRREILEDAREYERYIAGGGQEKTGAAWEEIVKDRAAYIGLMASNAARQEKSDAELQAALEDQGMSKDDARQTVLAQAGIESNTARMVVLLEGMAGQKMNDPDVGGIDYDGDARTPGMGRARYSPPYGSRGGGGGGRTIVVRQYLDGREIARTVHRETGNLVELGEVA